MLTGLIKLVGMYVELEAQNRATEILSYNPDTDNIFKYENLGYTTISKEIRKTLLTVSRGQIKRLSRKWPCSRVRVSFDAAQIIAELLSYISQRTDLKVACDVYLKGYDFFADWSRIIPIQYDFLDARIQDKHENWGRAVAIVNDLRRLGEVRQNEISQICSIK